MSKSLHRLQRIADVAAWFIESPVEASMRLVEQTPTMLRLIGWLGATPVRFAWQWATGKHLEFDDEGGKDGIPTFVLLQIFVLTQAVGINVTEFRKGVRPFSIVLYIGMSLVVLGVMVGIIRAYDRETTGSRRIHTFSRSTVRFGSWVLGCSIAFAVVMVALASKGLLVGQQPTKLTRTGIVDYTWKFDDSDGIIVSHTIVPLQFDDGKMPRDLRLKFSIQDPLAANWHVEKVIAFTDADKTIRVDAGPSLYDEEDRFTRHADFNDLSQRVYYLDIYLHRRDGSTMPRKEAKPLLDRDALEIIIREPGDL